MNQNNEKGFPSKFDQSIGKKSKKNKKRNKSQISVGYINSIQKLSLKDNPELKKIKRDIEIKNDRHKKNKAIYDMFWH